MALLSVTNAQVAIGFNASVTLNVTGFQNPVANQLNLSFIQQYAFGTGAGQVDEIIDVVNAIGAGATVALTLSASMTNICAQALASLSAIRAVMVYLMTANDVVAGITGSATSSITLGADAGNPWVTGPFGATDTYKIKNGGRWLHVDTTDAGLAVAGTDVLQVVNDDGSVAGHYRLSIFGVH